MILAEKKCEPIESSKPSLSQGKALKLMTEIPKWTFREIFIERDFSFPDFRGAINFVDRVATVAEEAGHYPDIHILGNHVKLVLTTHAIKGLSPNDFIVAAKINMIKP